MIITEFIKVVTDAADENNLTGWTRGVYYALVPFVAAGAFIVGFISATIDEIKDRICN